MKNNIKELGKLIIMYIHISISFICTLYSNVIPIYFTCMRILNQIYLTKYNLKKNLYQTKKILINNKLILKIKYKKKKKIQNLVDK